LVEVVDCEQRWQDGHFCLVGVIDADLEAWKDGMMRFNSILIVFFCFISSKLPEHMPWHQHPQ